MDTHVVLIPGLGCDPRLFGRIRLGDYKKTYISWPIPDKKEPFQTYCRRAFSGVENPQSCILVGVSLGGVAAQIIASEVKFKGLILISSIDSPDQIPWYIRMMEHAPLYHFIPYWMTIALAKATRKVLGKTYDDGKDLFIDMVRITPQETFTYGLHQILKWKGSSIKNKYAIHGTRDLVFPFKNRHPDHIIAEGNHFMVYNKAQEVEEAILKCIRDFERRV